MPKFDFAIIRPYITLPGEGGGVDRYLTLKDSLREIGISSVLYASNFRHNAKSKRIQVELGFDGIEFVDAGSYKKNLSLARLWFEIKFSYHVYKKLIKGDIRAILIGEPIFASWPFLLFLKFRKNIKIYGDFIDLMPEAFTIKFKNKFFFDVLILPMKITRWIRINFIYDKIFFVSTYYRDYLNSSGAKDGGVFYWGGKNDVVDREYSRDSNKIIYAGSLGEGYDIETVIELGKIRPDLNIVIAGSGPKASLCESAHKGKYVSYLGQINAAELAYVYATSSIGLLPYKKYSAVSMPIKLFDYIDNRLRVVSSLKMECEAILNSYNIGLNYESGNVESLSRAIDAALKLKVHDSVFKNLADNFSTETQYEKFAVKIKSLITS